MSPVDVFALARAPRNLAPGSRVHRRPGLWWSAHPLPVAQLNTARPDGPDAARWIDAVWRTAPGVSRWSVPRPEGALVAALEAGGWAARGRFVALSAVPGVGEAGGACPASVWAETWFAARGRACPRGDWAQLGSLTWAGPGGVAAMWVDRVRRVGVLWGAAVVPEARGRGAWRQLVSTRLAAAATLGLRAVWTIARDDGTAPALLRMGFVRSDHAVSVWEREGEGT